MSRPNLLAFDIVHISKGETIINIKTQPNSISTKTV